jgi:DNA-binding transcriptional MerR regulator
MTAGRTYLSIGDVLTLLRQEFPDVTISKIRFLESQGLVNPERTPSGYRKFYDHDVERLRWVLRQQREHFLPLKVIKGRLEDETSSDDSEARLGNGRRSDSAVRSVGELAGSPPSAEEGEHTSLLTTSAGMEDRNLVERASGDRRREVPDHLPGFDPPAGGESLERHLAGEAAGQAMSRPVYAPAQGAAARSAQHSRPAQSGASRPLGTTSTGNAARQATQAAQGHPIPDRSFGGGLKVPWPGSVGTREPASAPEAWHPSDRAEERSGAHEAQDTQSAQVGSARRTRNPGGSHRAGVGKLTISEIAAAAGLTESAIEELDSYGILSGRMVGGVAHFDESEVTIARVAAEFAQFGIEPRHLRLYKHASEREAGFVEQLVLPLLKQRNPEARKRAEEMVTDLTRLGEGLKAAMVKRSLQDLFGE